MPNEELVHFSEAIEACLESILGVPVYINILRGEEAKGVEALGRWGQFRAERQGFINASS
jgi:hypothetical protein